MVKGWQAGAKAVSRRVNAKPPKAKRLNTLHKELEEYCMNLGQHGGDLYRLLVVARDKLSDAYEIQRDIEKELK